MTSFYPSASGAAHIVLAVMIIAARRWVNPPFICFSLVRHVWPFSTLTMYIERSLRGGERSLWFFRPSPPVRLIARIGQPFELNSTRKACWERDRRIKNIVYHRYCNPVPLLIVLKAELDGFRILLLEGSHWRAGRRSGSCHAKKDV